MDMKIIKREKRLCTCCMEEHEVKTVLVEEKMTFKNVKIVYEADVFYMDEEQMQKNYLNQKAAYQKIINGSVDEKI